MLYTIPASRADEAREALNKMIRKVNRLGGQMSYTIGLPYSYRLDPATMVEAIDVAIEADQLIRQPGGWSVIAHLEHTPKGNIVTMVNGCDAPASWYNIDPNCDHCHTIRARSITYMVEDNNGNIKQVGRSCLRECTGIIPELCIAYMDIDRLGEEWSQWDNDCIRASALYPVEDVLAYAMQSIEQRGYVRSDESGSTKLAVFDALANNATIDDWARKYAHDIIDWLASLPDDTIGLEADCKALAAIGWCKRKHIGRLAYMPVAYQRDMERKAVTDMQTKQGKDSNYIGKLGQRITASVESAKVVTSWDTSYGVTYLVKFTTADNNVLVWYASKCPDLSHCTEIIGTVKEYKDYNGIRQTVLTRCKIK